MAAPPSSPEYQASRTAFACSSIQLTPSALPFINTTTSGLPAAATDSTSASSGCGEIETGAVAAEESRLVDGHLFALETAGDADGRDHEIGFAGGGYGFGRRCVVYCRPDELGGGLAVVRASILDL